MLRQSLHLTCLIVLLCMLPACSSSSQQGDESTVGESVDSSATQKQPTVLDEQLKALDKAKAVEATLEDAKAARDKAIDEASGG